MQRLWKPQCRDHDAVYQRDIHPQPEVFACSTDGSGSWLSGWRSERSRLRVRLLGGLSGIIERRFCAGHGNPY